MNTEEKLRLMAHEMTEECDPTPLNWPAACLAGAEEINRLRTALMFIATAYYSAPEVLREAAREACEAVPNA